MMPEYEQLELDTRSDLKRAISGVTADAIANILEMIQGCGEAPDRVHNRHEAYGIAAQQLSSITSAVKKIKDDTALLLGTLSDPNYPALEATSSIVNSTAAGAITILTAAAEMRRTLDNLYIAENQNTAPAPLDEMSNISDDAFCEVELADPDTENNMEE
jgi:hypothetical protein